MIQENVRGAQPWVGRAQWHLGAYYLWGDVPVLMPPSQRCGIKQGGDWFNAASLDKDGSQAISRRSSSTSPARKAAVAHIAKIPAPLARHIAQVYQPRTPEAAPHAK